MKLNFIYASYVVARDIKRIYKSLGKPYWRVRMAADGQVLGALMSLKSSLAARFLIALTTITTSVSGVNAQSAAVNRIISCAENEVNHSLVLITAKNTLMAAPSIQYLAGEDGRTVMVADFVGLSWIDPAMIIRPKSNGKKNTIELVRVGQFQANPPICRIALETRNPSCLKKVSFISNPGILVIKWDGTSADRTALVTPHVVSDQPQVFPRPTQKLSTPAMISTRIPAQAPAISARDQSEPQPAPAIATSASKTDDQDRIGDLISTAHRSTLKSPTSKKQTRDAAAADDEPSRGQGAPILAQPTPVATHAMPAGRIDTQLSSAHVTATPPKTTLMAAQAASAPTFAPAKSAPRGQAKIATAPVEEDSIADGPWPDTTKPAEPVKPVTHVRKRVTIPRPEDFKSLVEAFNDKPTVSTKRREDKMPPAAPPLNQMTLGAENGFTPEESEMGSLRTKENEEKPAGPPMARLTIINGKSDPTATVQIIAERHIASKSFRLHDPERYVIDIKKDGDLDEATVAAFESNPFLKTVRIGTPDENTCRIVFDLNSEDVSVGEQTYYGDDKLLTITVTPKIAGSAPTPSTAIERPSRQLHQLTVVLDAGHGGSDPGAQRGDIQEKDMTLAIVRQLQKRLETNGLHVIMTRNDDTFVSLEDRAKVTNTVMPSVFVSVHINALESTNDIHGIETYFQTEQSKPLADVIHTNLVQLLGVPDRGVRRARFYVINHTPVPAILAEVGFISNKDERDKLISSDYQGKVADALSQGVMLYLGKGSNTQQTQANKAAKAPADKALTEKGTSAKATKSVASSLSQQGAKHKIR